MITNTLFYWVMSNIIISSPRRVQSIVISMSVCLFACPLAYLRNHAAKLHQFVCTLPVTVARSFRDGVATRFVLPVL